tara:strand:+ start:2363 stop:3115 length:753 start_codon:yes stop_codon:yes gene_type:complete
MEVGLFFCGDSNTFGEELQGIEDNHDRRVEKRYSTLVSKELGKTHHNISQSGACNDWIVKNVVEWFEAGNTCDIAVIQFSHEARWGYYDENGTYENMPRHSLPYQSNHYQLYTQQNCKVTDVLGKIPQSTREAYEAYCKNIWSEQLQLDNYWKNMFFLRSYLKDKCKVVWMTLNKIPKETMTHGSQRETNVWSKLCKDIEIGEQGVIVKNNKCPRIGSEDDIKNGKGLPGSHPSEIGHQNIAKYILERLA